MLHACGVVLTAAGATWITGPSAPDSGAAGDPFPTRRHVDTPASRITPPIARNTVEPASESRVAVAAIREAGGSVTMTNDGQVRAVNLTGSTIEDDDLRHLSALPRMTLLNLDGTRITDHGLQHIRDLPGLSILRLARTPITDAGLKRLQNLPGLTTLILDDTAVTDAGFANLEQLPSLGSISAMGCPITSRAEEIVRTHAPGCRIKR